MPKIIENVRSQLIEEAKKQIAENGYGKTTIRSVAGACGLGVGTVYNYFKSKDMLIASFMAEEWLETLSKMKELSDDDSCSMLKGDCSALKDYINKHQSLFSDSDAAKVFATVFTERHKQLRGQIAELILPLCEKSSVPNNEFLSEFIAESILTWTVADKSFEEQYSVISQLLK